MDHVQSDHAHSTWRSHPPGFKGASSYRHFFLLILRHYTKLLHTLPYQLSKETNTMYSYRNYQASNCSDMPYKPARSAAPDPTQPPNPFATRTGTLPASTEQRPQPHLVENPNTSSQNLICRCADSTSHPSAIVPENRTMMVDSTYILDEPFGQRIKFVAYAHKLLDMAGQESISLEQAMVVWPQMLESVCVRLMKYKECEARSVAENGWRYCPTGNEVWLGRMREDGRPGGFVVIEGVGVEEGGGRRGRRSKSGSARSVCVQV
jgi:hypothetical protein